MRNARFIAVVGAAGLIVLSGVWYFFVREAPKEAVSAPQPALSVELSAAPDPAEAVTLLEAYAYPPPPGAANGAIYFTLVNSGPELTLVGARTDVAQSASLHESVLKDAVMSMKGLQSLILPAGGTMVFKPGGKHIMLDGLTGPPKIGDTILLTLEFSGGRTATFSVPVLAR